MMTNLLAIDTSTPACTLALQCGTKRFSALEASAAKHTQLILPMLEQLLQQAQIAAADLHGIIVSIGPGAFTGLRVGAAAALGLAYGSGAKLLPISSLALQAQTAQRLTGQRIILSTFDARMGEIYAGFYAEGKALCPDGLYRPEDLWTWQQQHYPEAYAVGSGTHYPPFAESALPEQHALLPQAVDAFDLLSTEAPWQEAHVGLELNYLRNHVVDIPKAL